MNSESQHSGSPLLHPGGMSLHLGKTVPLVSSITDEQVEGATLCVLTNKSMAQIASEKTKEKERLPKAPALAFSAQQEVPRREEMERITREKRRDADPSETEPPPSEEPESAPEQPKE